MEENNKIDFKTVKQKTDQVQDIIDRMPTKFGYYTSLIVIFIFSLLLIFGFVIRYPDVVKGKIDINNSITSVKLVSNNTGQLRLIKDEFQTNIKKGEPIAYIYNTIDYQEIKKIKDILSDFLNETNYIEVSRKLPQKVTLGEITPVYYQFLHSLKQVDNDNSIRPYDSQKHNLKEAYYAQVNELENQKHKLGLMKRNLEYVKKIYFRDSLLFVQGVISELELDQSSLRYLEAKNNVKSFESNINSVKEKMHNTKSSINDIGNQHSIKTEGMEFDVMNSYNLLMEEINKWEHKSLIYSPVNGILQKMGFWQENQFVRAGEELYMVRPKQKGVIGQMLIPSIGAGKVEQGQEVMVKLDDYPYLEYGLIKGKVKSISSTKKEVQIQNTPIEHYLAIVEFSNGLETNYGREIKTNKSMSGTAEIITKDRKLIERFFDNLKYAIKK